MNGNIYGMVARVINCILFTPLLALSSIAKIFPATIPSYLTDSELVIVVSLTHTYCVVMTSNLSILWNSSYSKTHISGMCQLAGHS